MKNISLGTNFQGLNRQFSFPVSYTQYKHRVEDDGGILYSSAECTYGKIKALQRL